MCEKGSCEKSCSSDIKKECPVTDQMVKGMNQLITDNNKVPEWDDMMNNLSKGKQNGSTKKELNEIIGFFGDNWKDTL